MRSNTDVLPLELTVPFQEFVSVYRAANLDPTEINFNKLYNLLQPAFKVWQQVWVSKRYIDNVNISSLINLLRADNSPVGDIKWKLKTYNEYLRLNNLTLVDELNYCLVEHFKKDKHIYDRYYEEKNLLFFIAKDIKMFLFKKIRKVLANYRKCGDFKLRYPHSKIYYDFTLDLSFLETSALHNTVLLLLMQQNGCANIKNILSISQKQYKETVECLLQNLKQLNK